MIFSIVIPTFDRPEILKKTLDCLEKQGASLAYEVIVVDDYSTTPFPDLGFGKGKRAISGQHRPFYGLTTRRKRGLAAESW
jgi:GT2 family glycosyltransferase